MARCALLLAAAAAVPAGALRFADPFLGEGAVIQRAAAAPVWGTSSEAEVTVKVDGAAAATAAVGADGAWSVRLPPQTARFNSTLTVSDAGGTQSITVSFGDVLLCAGQSNMDMAVNYPKFHADNGTAEVAAAGRYTGRISLKCMMGRPCGNGYANGWFPTTPDSLTYFSAICWYTAKALYEHEGGKIPFGLIQGENGGTPIEAFIPTSSIAKCNPDSVPCKDGLGDGHAYAKIVTGLAPYAVGAILWDQAEADVTAACPHVDEYPCLEQELVRTWRGALGSPQAPFVAVQLPGYANPVAGGVFRQRLAQEQGLAGVAAAALLPTYDLSCPNCPNGAVHNTDKEDVALRAAAQLRRLLYGEAVDEGPRVQLVEAAKVAGGYEVTATFSGGALPLTLRPTRNCTGCCGTPGGDFDASVDGTVWVKGKAATAAGAAVRVLVPLSAPPTVVRYTAAADYPQCAVYNAAGLPAFPFEAKVGGAPPAPPAPPTPSTPAPPAPPPSPACTYSAYGRGLGGKQLGAALPAATKEECCALCRANAECKAAGWRNATSASPPEPVTPTCHLKDCGPSTCDQPVVGVETCTPN